MLFLLSFTAAAAAAASCMLEKERGGFFAESRNNVAISEEGKKSGRADGRHTPAKRIKKIFLKPRPRMHTVGLGEEKKKLG